MRSANLAPLARLVQETHSSPAAAWWRGQARRRDDPSAQAPVSNRPPQQLPVRRPLQLLSPVRPLESRVRFRAPHGLQEEACWRRLGWRRSLCEEGDRDRVWPLRLALNTPGRVTYSELILIHRGPPSLRREGHRRKELVHVTLARRRRLRFIARRCSGLMWCPAAAKRGAGRGARPTGWAASW